LSSSVRAEPRRLALDDGIRLGLANNQTLRSSRAGVQLAGAREREAVIGRLPSLKLSGGYTRVNEIDPFVFTFPSPPGQLPRIETIVPSIPNNYSARLSLQQPLFTGLRLQSIGAIASDNSQAARQDYARDQAQLIYNVKNSYWNLYRVIEARKVVDQNVERIRAHLDDIKHLQAQGLATRNDVLKVQVQLSNAHLLQIDARNGIQLARTSLNSLVGLVLDTETEPSSELGDDPEEPQAEESLPALVQKARAGRPEVKAMEWRARAASDAVALARSGWYPQIAATGNCYLARPNQRIFPPTDKFTPSWDVGVGATFDVWNWGLTAHQTAEAKAQLTQAQAALAQLGDGITLEVTQDYLNLQQAREKVAAAETALVQAEENRRVAGDGFKAGTVLSADLLDAETNLLQVQLGRTQARVDLELAKAKLTRTIGE
jgi:outer membrane protein TolC